MSKMETMLAQWKRHTWVQRSGGYVRQRRILKQHSRVAGYWDQVIADYVAGDLPAYKLTPKQALGDGRIIWQYWGQGFDQLPEVVEHSVASVDRYAGDFRVIRLDDSSIADYLDLPSFVIEKQREGVFNRTFFSDLLRLALLSCYGGVWLDATVLLTGEIPERYTDMDYFVFQRDPAAEWQSFWRESYAYYWSWHPDFKVNMLSSFFVAKAQSSVVQSLLDLLLYYWETEERLHDYFTFQILYNQLLDGPMQDRRCLLEDDTVAHLLQTRLNGGLTALSYGDIVDRTSIHKLSYFNPEGMERLRHFLNTYSS